MLFYSFWLITFAKKKAHVVIDSFDFNYLKLATLYSSLS
jgi:hypothetical protein